MQDIEKLTPVSARLAWSDEARDFTPWLAKNLDRIEEVIGIRLELDGVEVSVHQFYADILATDPVNDRKVLIENQLEKADHKHLGQIMTYLAGLDADVVVWIATSFTDAHLATLRWLNDHTVEPFAFFAIQVQLVTIGDSKPALILDVVERPNDWERSVKKATRNTPAKSERAVFREEYWGRFNEVCPDAEAWEFAVNASSSQWIPVPGCEPVYLSAYVSDKGVGVFLRGERGVKREEFNQFFEPFLEDFKRAIGSDIQGGVLGSGSHPGRFLSLDTKDLMARDETIRRHCAEIKTWLDAAKDILPDTPSL